jgi:hypothetical protein
MGKVHCAWFTRLMLICSAILLLLLPSVLARGQTVSRLQLISATVEEYPRLDVVFTFSGGSGTADLSPADISLSIDNGPPISSALELSETVRPLDIAIVADVGPGMADLSSPPDRTRLREMLAQIRELVRLLPPDTALSLTTFDSEARVAFPLKADGNGFLNTLDQFVFQPFPAEVLSASYPLTEALRLGLSTLARAADDPRPAAQPALLLFAAGQPGLNFDSAALDEELAQLADNSPLLTIIGLGGDQEGQFREFAGGPASLEELASELGAAFVPLYTADSAEVATLSERLQRLYNELLDQRIAYQLSATIDGIEPGEHRLRLGVAGLSQEAPLLVVAPPTQVDLYVASPQIQGTTVFSVTVQSDQAPITRVEYILNNVPVGSSESGPDYALTFDAAAEPWSDLFPPGSYPLFAAATDSNGEVYRTTLTTVEVLAPPPTTMAGALANPMVWGSAVGALGLAGVAVWLWRRSRRVTASPRAPTHRHQPEGGLRGPTKRRNPRSNAPAVRITIAEGEPSRTVTLRRREGMIGRDPQADIPLSNDEVSWNHAVLSMVQGGVLQLSDLRSTNGTFVGAARTPVSDSSPVMLRAGDTFWIGPVRLVVEAVD